MFIIEINCIQTHEIAVNSRVTEFMYGLDYKFYAGKNILVTGHSGFKGSWLTYVLVKSGADVTGVSLDPPSSPDLYSILDLRKHVNSYKCDIRDARNLKNIFKKCKPEMVFHFAAQPIVKTSYDDPSSTYDVNIMGTVNLLEAIRYAGSVDACIIATSDKCYDNSGHGESYFTEDDRLGGIDPYSSSKACVELIADSYRRSFFDKAGIGIATVRCGNVIGGGDWGKFRLVPDVIEAIEQEKTVKLRNPESIRPWVYILDAIGGYLLLGKNISRNMKEFSSAWNIGPSTIDARYKTSYIAEKLSELYMKGQFEKSIPDFYENEILRISPEKFSKKTGWKTLYDIDESLVHAVEWYRSYYSGMNMKDITGRFFEEYLITAGKEAK